MDNKRIVVALGRNAFGKTFPEQQQNVKKAAFSFPLLYPHSSAARLAVGTLLSAIITPHTVEARQNTSASAAIFVTTGESAPSGALSFFLYTKFVNADPRGPSPLRFRTADGSPPDTGSPSGY